MSRTRKHKQLSDIANIRAGYTFREKVNEIEAGNAHIVQIKDARKALAAGGGNQLLPDFLPMINWHGNQKTAADAECVILPVRGDYSCASYIKIGSIDAKPILVSSQFLIITPKNKLIQLEYLCWALNQPSAQNYFKQESRGTKMSMLSIGSVSALKLPIPSIDIQDRIIKLNQLWESEQKIFKNLLDNRQLLLQGMFRQLLDGK